MPVPPLPCREGPSAGNPTLGEAAAEAGGSARPAPAPEPVLCGHCGRTATNGISCQGMCVADSGY
ncbi:hypothetical protein NZK32_01810 [Cyanobium sp. FGCU-52]|nr:hypothetical protein [Cyanobium sp. FGCU52]